MKTLVALVLTLALVAAACNDDAGAETTIGDTTPVETTAANTDDTTPADTTADTTAPTDTGCESDAFLIEEVNSYEQTGGYVSPELAVECTDDTFVVTGNGAINYEFVQITPNDLAAQDNRYEIPREPTERSVPGAMGLGTVGVAVNGVAVFGAFEAPQDDYQDPFLDGLLDFCNGHTAPGGVYHYHARFDCLFDNDTAVGTVYGYLFDGYEMASPWVCTNDDCSEIRKVTSSYARVDETSLAAFTAWEYQEGSGDLDVCNGITGSDGVYRYHITDAFPYVPFCFHGETNTAQGDHDGDPPAGGPGG